MFQKFPLSLRGSFNVNSDIEFVIKLIDSLKEEFKTKPKPKTENENEKDNEKTNETKKTKDSNNKEEEDEKFHKPSKMKRKSQEIINEKIIKNIHNDSIKILNDKTNNEKILDKEKNLSKIKQFLLEFIQDNNIIVKKRTNSMTNLRPHSQTIISNTTCDTSIAEIEDFKNNININNLNENNNKNKINIKINKNNINEQKNIYENIFLEKEAKDSEKKQEKFLVNKSETILRDMKEMTSFYKEEKENEDNIKFKQPENKLIFIHPDIFLKKIIFEDFLNNNILLVYHFCQQCFCFINKEVFFKKLLDCYKFYKKKISLVKINNLIEFYNVLIIEMFYYYQKINLKDAYVKEIKNFYLELITDLITLFETEKEKNNENNENKNNQNKENDNSMEISEDKCNNTITRENLINTNLNVEQNEIKIFFLEENEKEIEKKDNEKKNIEKTKRYSIQPSLVSTSLHLRTIRSSSEKIILNDNLKKDMKIENNKDLSLSDKELSFKEYNTVIKETDKEDDLDLYIEEDNRPQSIYISKKLMSSQVIPSKKFSDDNIEKGDQKIQKTLDEKPIELSLYSDKSESEPNSLSESESENDSNEEKKDDLNTEKKNLKKNDKNNEKVEDNRKINEKIINSFLKSCKIPENFLQLNEKILKTIKYILSLFEKEKDGEPKIEDIMEAKKNIKFYKKLYNLIDKTEKKQILVSPFQRHKRNTQRFSLFSFGQNVKQKKESKGYFCVNDWGTEDIGDTLMAVSKSLLNKIQPRELYRAVFIKKNKEITSPNLVNCINKSISLTNFIIEDIISYSSRKERAKTYEKWVQIADYCKLNKDYNDLYAIFSALNNYIITGLKETLKYINYKYINMFKQIKEFCTLEGNYKIIREDIDECNKNGEIFVPHPAILMKDINYFEESSKYVNEKGCINIEKIEKITEILEKHFKYKKLDKKIEIKKELKFFEDLEMLTEEELEEIEKKVEKDKESVITKGGRRLTNIDKKYFGKENKKSVISLYDSYLVLNYATENKNINPP